MLNKKALAAARIGASVPTDADFEYVTLLLHGDGTNGAQNNTFIDGSTNNFTVTRTGTVTQGSLNPFGDRWSNYFDGTTDWLEVANNTALNLSSGDFAIECWFYSIGALTSQPIILQKDWTPSGTFPQYGLTFSSGGALMGVVGNASSSEQVVTGTTVVQRSTWNHAAFTKSGSTLRLFLNGALEATATSITMGSSTMPFVVGAGGTAGTSRPFNGYVSNLRIVKGSAVYTAAFTPPTTPLTAITNTSLLTCQSNRFRDNSSNNFTITRNGDVSVRPFSPFSPSAAYSTSTNGGSSYYGTTDSYLTLPDNANLRFGSSNFTFELWFYKVSNPGAATNIIGWNTNSNNSAFAALRLQLENANTVTLLMSESGSSWQVNATSSSTYVNNTWNHLAVVRNGATVTVYVNGVSFTSGSLSSSSASLFAGTVNNINDLFFNTNTWSMIGYISNARLVIGTAVYTAAFTPPTAPLTAITNTSLLLNFTNGGIIDNAADNVLETVGNAQISTSVKKYGTGSLAFDGTGDYLVPYADIEAFAFGSGNFTIEFWVYLNSTQTAIFYDGRPVSGAGATPTIYVSSNTLYYFTNNANVITGSTLSNTTWYHVAVCKSGSSTKMFVDGTQVGSTYTDNVTYVNSAGRPIIGASGNTINQFPLNGYIDDLRITKGVARYTANFTPPTAAFPDL